MKRIKLDIEYSDGVKKTHYFKTVREATWFAAMDGDHVIKFSITIKTINKTH